MSLGSRGTFFSLSFPYHCTSAFSSHLVGCVPCLFFLILSTTCLFHISLHPEWWSSSVHHMEDSHVIFHHLSRGHLFRDPWFEKVISLETVLGCLSTWVGVHPLSTSPLGFICSCSGYVYLYIWKKKWNEKKKKKKKKKISTCVYVPSILHCWVCMLMFEGHCIEYVCWWEFVCELPETLHFLYSFLSYILWARWVTFS